MTLNADELDQCAEDEDSEAVEETLCAEAVELLFDARDDSELMPSDIEANEDDGASSIDETLFDAMDETFVMSEDVVETNEETDETAM